jgi:hypothetical protein
MKQATYSTFTGKQFTVKQDGGKMSIVHKLTIEDMQATRAQWSDLGHSDLEVYPIATVDQVLNLYMYLNNKAIECSVGLDAKGVIDSITITHKRRKTTHYVGGFIFRNLTTRKFE